MSQPPTTPDLTDRTRQVFDAASRRDSDAVLSFFAPDAVMDLSDGGLGTFRGIGAVRGFLEDWFGTWDSYEVDPEEVCDFGHGVVFIVYGEQGSMGSMGSVGQRRAWCLLWVEDLISFVAVYLDPEQARAAAQRLAEERE
ncbi:MAG TPA: nuclear transport factor 2 family protein [Solirubrobacteraceae bacterium]|nr:nuclear transport factor 2 family protein [Solirubrobacteraceae bacterium]